MELTPLGRWPPTIIQTSQTSTVCLLVKACGSNIQTGDDILTGKILVFTNIGVSPGIVTPVSNALIFTNPN